MNMIKSFLAYLFLGIVSSSFFTGSGGSYVEFSDAKSNLVFHSEVGQLSRINFDAQPFFVPVHSWYPQECCQDIDCAPVEAQAVRRTASGWYIVESKETIDFLDLRIRPSLDGQIHRCVE